MACKVPVIGYDSGEIPHVIGDAGLIFPESHTLPLANSLSTLIHNPEAAQNVAQLAYERVLKKYTNKALAKEKLECYEKLLTKN